MKNILLCRKSLFYLILLLLFTSFGLTSAAQTRNLVVDTLTKTIDATQPPFDQVKPGDTVFLSYGHRDYLLIRNFEGDSANPITFMNFGGVVIIDTEHYYGISVENCRHIRITGTGSNADFYGFQINRVLNGGGIGFLKLSSDFELDHMSIKNVLFSAIVAKSDPNCLFNSTRDKFTQYNTLIHDNYLENIGNEGMYIGSSRFNGQTVTCNGTDTLLMPSFLDGVRIYGNIIKYTGWDGMQISSAVNNCRIYDNLIMFDSQDEIYGQMSGILIGGGSKCDCYNNYISNGKGNGIESYGLGGYRIFNNIIENPGRSYYPLDLKKMVFGILVNDISIQHDSSFLILFNDIINPKSDGIRFLSIVSNNNLIASNAIINPGNFDYYENGGFSFKGIDSYVMIPDKSARVAVKNNYFARTADSAGFAATNFSLLPQSPLIDVAFPENHGVDFDFYHHLRPFGPGYDIGAFEYNPAYLGNVEQEPALKPMSTLFPNPVETNFTIGYQNQNRSEVVLRMFNLQGIKLLERVWNQVPAGAQTITENIENLPEGIYLYTLRVGNQSHSGRFVKVTRK